MTMIQRVFNAFHGLVSQLDKDDEDRPIITEDQLSEELCGAVEGELREFFKPIPFDEQTRVV